MLLRECEQDLCMIHRSVLWNIDLDSNLIKNSSLDQNLIVGENLRNIYSQCREATGNVSGVALNVLSALTDHLRGQEKHFDSAIVVIELLNNAREANNILFEVYGA